MLSKTVVSKRVNVLIPCGCGQCDLMIWKFDEHNGWKERTFARGHALKGKKFSEEHKSKITEAKIGHEVSEETREKISKKLTGTILSQETKHKISESSKGEKNHMYGKKGPLHPSYGKPISDKQKKFLSEIRKGELNPGWKGGRRKNHGYIMIWQPDHPYCDKSGYVLEHRLVYEKYMTEKWGIRFIIHPSLEIHHKNEKKADNRMRNLQLLTSRDHSLLHSLLKIEKGHDFFAVKERMKLKQKAIKLSAQILEIMSFEDD